MVVVVPMIIQALLALGLACFADSPNAFILWINFVLIAIIWIITALYSVPSHRSLCSKWIHLISAPNFIRCKLGANNFVDRFFNHYYSRSLQAILIGYQNLPRRNCIVQNLFLLSKKNRSTEKLFSATT
jgi:hypothetical protein